MSRGSGSRWGEFRRARRLGAAMMGHPVSGHVYRFEGKRRPVWRAKYRLPDGRQVKKTLGPAWTARGRPPAGYFTRRTAEAWLRATLARGGGGHACRAWSAPARRSRDACAEYLRYIEQDRQRKPSTLRDYDSIFRNHVLPHLGDVRLEDLTPERVERWAAHEIDPDRRLGEPHAREDDHRLPRRDGASPQAATASRRTRSPTSRSHAPPPEPRSTSSRPEEVMALVRAADSEQDAAIYLTAAFTGLRQGELVALRWRDVDFPGSAIRVRASYTNGHLTSPKSGKVRSVPMAAAGRRGPRPPRPARVLHRRRRPRLRSASPAATSTAPPSPSATAPRSSEPASAHSASTTSATPSAPASSASPTSAASRSGWATRTSRRRCSTSTTSRARRTPRS